MVTVILKIKISNKTGEKLKLKEKMNEKEFQPVQEFIRAKVSFFKNDPSCKFDTVLKFHFVEKCPFVHI